MKNISFIVFCFFSSCLYKAKPEPYLNPDRQVPKPLTGKKIIFSGSLSGLNAKSIYFFQHPYFEQILDSSNIINGSFRLIIDSSLLLNINDVYGLKLKLDDNSIRKVFFYNHVLSSARQKYILDSYIIDTNFINITKSQSDDSTLVIKAGKTNDSYFRIQMMQFGYLDTDSVKRKVQLENYSSIINQFPSSRFLLNQLFENRSVIRKNEFASLLQLFDTTVLHSDMGKFVLNYLVKKSDNQLMPNMELEDSEGNLAELFPRKEKMHMLVVWASWCGPCIKEIPSLKALYEKYKNQGLSITSISIDDNSLSWKAALFNARMPWRQLIVPKEKVELFKNLFEVGSIPYVIFIDSEGKEITRSIGVDANTKDEYNNIILKHINS